MLSCENKIKSESSPSSLSAGCEGEGEMLFLKTIIFELLTCEKDTTRQTAILSVDFTLESISAHQESLIQFTNMMNESRFSVSWEIWLFMHPQKDKKKKELNNFFLGPFLCVSLCVGFSCESFTWTINWEVSHGADAMCVIVLQHNWQEWKLRSEKISSAKRIVKMLFCYIWLCCFCGSAPSSHFCNSYRLFFFR